MKNSKNNYYTFMFFPEGRGTPFTLRIHRYTVYLTMVSVILIFAGLFILLFKTGEISLRLQMVHSLKQENARLKERSRDLEISSEKIAGIDSLTAYLHRLASVSGIDGSVQAASRVSSQAGASSRPGAPVVDGRPGIQPLVRTEAARTDSQGALAVRRASAAGDFAESVPNIMPVDGWITKPFSPDPADAHHAMDIAAATGTPIRATAMGVVEDVRNDRFLGLVVELRHDNGFVTRYAHCSQILVTIGDRVNRGQTIALVGNTGRSTAPHLHYEVIKNGRFVDPMNFIGAQKQ